MTSPAPVYVQNPDDERLADYVNLRGPEFRRVYERQRGIFVAEGERVVQRLLGSGWNVRSLLVAQDRAERFLPRLGSFDAPVYLAAQAVIDRLTAFNLHRGLLAAADRPEPRRWIDVADTARRLLVVERISDQENLGILFRSAAALGAGGLLTSPDCCDPLYRRTVRVSMGAIFSVPFAQAAPWPGALRELSERGWEVVALTPAADAEDLEDIAAELSATAKVALVVGNEGDGLSDGALGAARRRVRIPMSAGADSLNVAMAATVGLYAVGRGPTG